MPIPFLPEIVGLLRAGTELAVSHVLRRPISHARKLARITRLAGRLTERGLDQLIGVAEAGIRAGEVVTQKLPTGEVTTTDFAEQPHLFGDDPGGRRFLLEVDVFNPDIGRRIRMTLELGDIDDLNRVQEMAADELRRRVGESPGAFNDPNLELIDVSTITVSFAERRF